MKKVVTGLLSIITVATLALFSASGFAAVGSTAGSARDLNKLKANITLLNQDAGLPAARTIIKKHLSDTYSVKTEKIDSLLGKNMTFGDMAAVLAFADHMTGGTSDVNINRVAELRMSGREWDQIAESVRVYPSIVGDSLTALEDKVHTGIREALVESPSAGEAAGGPGMSGGQTERIPGGAMGGTGTSGQ